MITDEKKQKQNLYFISVIYFCQESKVCFFILPLKIALRLREVIYTEALRIQTWRPGYWGLTGKSSCFQGDSFYN